MALRAAFPAETLGPVEPITDSTSAHRMQPVATMMETVKDLISSMGSRRNRKRFANAADLAKSFGGSAADFAKRGGESAVVLAKKVGPKRGLIGLAVIGAAAVGGILLVRYLRAQAEEAEDFDAGEEPGTEAGRRARNESRAKRKEHNAITH